MVNNLAVLRTGASIYRNLLTRCIAELPCLIIIIKGVDLE